MVVALAHGKSQVTTKHVEKSPAAAYSPRLKQNIAIATIDKGFNAIGSKVDADTPWGSRLATVTNIPFN